MRTFLITLFSLLCLPFAANAQPEIGKPAPPFNAASAEGSTIALSAYKGKIVVLEWNNPGCPFVHKHYDSGNMQALQQYALSQGVVWLTVNSGAPSREGYMTAEKAKDYAASQHMAITHYLLDPDGTVGKLYGATATPNMFVIDAQGNLAYKGAIDDRPTADPKDIPVAHNYVRAAIDSLLAGKPVQTASTQPYGCAVKYAE